MKSSWATRPHVNVRRLYAAAALNLNRNRHDC
jgi:hypothetical protein